MTGLHSPFCIQCPEGDENLMPLEARQQIVQAFACELMSGLKYVLQSDLCRPNMLSCVGLPD